MKPAARIRTKKAAFRVRPVQKNSISDHIVQQIMKQIASGTLKPGERLPAERELCKSFHAGRSSLREALRCLSIMGVLNARAGEGTSVAADGSRFLETVIEWRFATGNYDIRNLMEIRISLEGLAAESCARRASEEERKAFEALHEQMRAAVDDARHFGTLDLEFHLRLAQVSQNQLIYDLISLVRGQLARTISEVLMLPDARPCTLEEHGAIVKAIRQHSPEAARTAMQAHLEAAITRYIGAQALAG